MAHLLSRRQTLSLGLGLCVGLPLLAACGAGATATTTAVTSSAAAPTTASQSAASQTTASATAAGQTTAQQTASAASTSAALSVAAAKTQLTFMRFPGAGWEQDVKFVDDFNKANPTIVVQPQDVLYADMYQKCLTLAAGGTMADVFAGHNKWMPSLAFKGVTFPLDALVNQQRQQIQFDDFFPSVIADARGIGTEGKLHWLPTVVHPGGNAVVIFNLDLLKTVGVEAPASSDWTLTQLDEIARKAANPSKGIWGYQLAGPSSPLYVQQFTRSWGLDPNKGSQDAWLLSADGKKEQLNSPPVQDALDWYWKLVRDGFVPRSDSPPAPKGFDHFTAGQMIAISGEIGRPQAYHTIIKDRFATKVVLWPKGPHGYRGSCLSYNTQAIGASTKHADAAFALLNQLTGPEIGFWAGYEGYANPFARHSVWFNPKLWEKYPIDQEGANWFAAGIDPFPQPANLHFQQWLDAWPKLTATYFDAKENYNAMSAKAQPVCQAILDEPK